MSAKSFSNPKTAVGSLLAGVSIIAISTGLPGWLGLVVDPGTAFFLTLTKGVGGLATLGGLVGLQQRYSIAQRRKVAEQPSGVHGTARFATLEEIEAAKMFDPNGLYLGCIEEDGRIWPIYHSGKAHLITVAPARQGKGVGVVIPNLLHYPGSVVVTDPKGELAATTAAHRRERMGHEVAVFNPYGLHDLPHAKINPLQHLIDLGQSKATQRGLLDESSYLVLQLLPEPEDTRNQFFRLGSRKLLKFGLIYLALFKPEESTLPKLFSLLASTTKLNALAQLAAKSQALGGVLSEMALDLLDQMANSPQIFEDFRSGALQALDIFQPGSYLGDAVSGSDVALTDLKSGMLSLYLAFPPDKVGTHGAALGLIVNQAIKAVSSGERGESVLFLLDEFANLGKLSGLAESLTALPGLGVRVWMIVQELAELERIYGRQTAQTIQSQAEVKQVFAISNDLQADALSKALGQRTVKTSSQNLGKSPDDELSESMSETGQPLLRPEEITGLDRSLQLLRIGNMPPIMAGRVPYWRVAPWADWAEANPVEGETPQAERLFTIDYQLKGDSDD